MTAPAKAAPMREDVTQEITACPFCTGKATLDQFCPTNMNEWRVICDGCEAWGPERKTALGAITAWNHRLAHTVRPDAGDEDVERPRITSDQFKSLPEPVRRYIMYIETDCDPSGTIRSEMHLRDHVADLEVRLLEVKGCFDAAVSEGLYEALNDTSDERLKDLVERRLMYAFADTLTLAASKDRSAVKVISQRLVDHMRKVARQGGWAIAVHGSMSRDLDLVAVPWTGQASDEGAFVEAMRAAMAHELGGVALIGAGEDGRNAGVKSKPNGRRSYTIHSTSEQLIESEIGAHPYIDLCVLDFRAALAAMREGVDRGMVEVPREVIAFLKGVGPLDGVWFGDTKPEGERGNFWWRKHLPTVPAALSTEQTR